MPSVEPSYPYRGIDFQGPRRIIEVQLYPIRADLRGLQQYARTAPICMRSVCCHDSYTSRQSNSFVWRALAVVPLNSRRNVAR